MRSLARSLLLYSLLLYSLLLCSLLAGGAATARAAELVMFERDDCPICLRWNREIAPVYPKTAEARQAPLRRVSIGADAGVALREPVRYTPTFVLAEDGQERGRITGYHNDESFWGLLDMMLAGAPTQ
jgi:hypothetical protein